MGCAGATGSAAAVALEDSLPPASVESCCVAQHHTVCYPCLRLHALWWPHLLGGYPTSVPEHNVLRPSWRALAYRFP
jgi:hypothetical protein